MEPLYTAEALSTGAGRNGHVRTTSGTVDLDLAIPKAMGGSGDGANPEELFAAGYAACFHSALQMVARQAKVAISDTSVGSEVHVLTNEKGGFTLAVNLEVVIPELAHEQAQALAEAAHQACPYSNATRGNIDVTVTVSQD
ncbi:organic hydroperoxide resistance protein [Tessaracoccus antarcticus]|uniref:Organic hydroperoxide resistance protein n=1 Tax=Tessaracoccus antarcticus TaxID=2479848 RepID=A0A3M0GJK5_9ACTN|nr:organic hydroperoxide resistance protein [Tessaracoccus antarcticus]RMB61309.1 organic hydroperoxide resistance protein [Tessaracoccus antarcticus]